MPGFNFFHTFACLSGATSVAFGAFGAHALKGKLSAHQASSWTTATSYQLTHSIALLYVASQIAPSISNSRPLTVAAYAFTAGITLFSGSIYGLCLTNEGSPIRKLLGPATPLGGLALIAGWVALALAKRGGVRLS
ncbi:DUF423-domain-containing protein [Acaromyces ingoldii]|uniref:DUF423-domain-containing protein n=1 Tax=Acaromyces ingoldii TaxID=215250 RepID=A0A316YXA7_9BASI|nr:DUF423-domain-containing protein [Acaromyces ingoldii]PWN93278.1 DUF423-domain-containing protein [Acaromyces ingoldii]